MKHQEASVIVIHDQSVIFNLHQLSSERDGFQHVSYHTNSEYICDLGNLIRSLFRGVYSLKRDQGTPLTFTFKRLYFIKDLTSYS